MNLSGRRAIGVALTTQAVAIGTTFGSFSLFVQPLELGFDAERWQISLGPALLGIALAVGGMSVGSHLDRGAIRRVMLASAILHATGLMLASQATGLPLLGLLCFTTGLAIPGLGPLAGSTLVGRVFAEDRGRALGFVNMGGPLGGFVFAALAGVCLEAWDWRTTLLFFAALSAAINIPITLLIPKHVEAAGAANDPDLDAGYSMAQLARSPAFLLLGSTFAIGTGITAGWSSQLAPFLDGLGLSLRAAAALIATSSGVAIAGTLLLGALSDRVSGALIFGSILVVGAAAFATYLLGPPLAVVAVALLTFGVMTGGLIPVYTTLLAQRFGVPSIGRAMGLTNLLMLPVSAASGPLAAAAHDSTGSYAPALLGFIAAYAAAGVALFASGRVRR